MPFVLKGVKNLVLMHLGIQKLMVTENQKADRLYNTPANLSKNLNSVSPFLKSTLNHLPIDINYIRKNTIANDTNDLKQETMFFSLTVNQKLVI